MQNSILSHKRSPGEIRAGRVEIVLHWLQRRVWTPQELRRAIIDRWGVDQGLADAYIREARQQMLVELRKGKEEHRCQSYLFYRSFILDPELSPEVRLRAQERLDRLLGLDSPSEIDLHVTAQTVPVEKLPLEVRKQLLEEIRKIKGRVNGEPSHELPPARS